MNPLDDVIINSIKNSINIFPGMKGTTTLFSQYLGFDPMFPMISILVISSTAVLIVKSEWFQKKFNNSKHKDLIANTIVVGGIILMVVILS